MRGAISRSGLVAASRTNCSLHHPNPAVQTMARAIQRFKTEYLPARRNFIYNTSGGSEIPPPQNQNPSLHFYPFIVAGAPPGCSCPRAGPLG